jgi:hypothetical protein
VVIKRRAMNAQTLTAQVKRGSPTGLEIRFIVMFFLDVVWLFLGVRERSFSEGLFSVV